MTIKSILFYYGIMIHPIFIIKKFYHSFFQLLTGRLRIKARNDDAINDGQV
jgi:hypothetical protein